MFKRTSLFWKIFLAFWLANVLVLVSATYFSLHARDQEESLNKKQQLANRIGDFVIPQLENPQLAVNPRNRYWQRIYKQNIIIMDDQNQVIFDALKEKKRHKKHKKHAQEKHPKTQQQKVSRLPALTFDYKSESGKAYHIQIPPDKAERLLHTYLKRLLVLRLSLILIFSGIVSYGLSLLIIRPLNQLAQHNRLLANRDFSKNDDTPMADIDQRLLQRPDEIGELAKEMQNMQLNISQLINTKQDLLHDVSHELRAPLARMMAATGLIQQKLGHDEKLTNRLETECQNMSVLIDRILHFSRLHHIEAKFEPLALSELLQQSLDDCQFEYPQQQLQFESTLKNTQISSDAELLKMALDNILRNACQHNPGHSHIRLILQKTENQWIISVEDNGRGLNNSQLQQLFTPFYRHPTSQGFGLGMTISQRIMLKLGGDIKAFNLQHRGLCVQLCLPIKAEN